MTRVRIAASSSRLRRKAANRPGIDQVIKMRHDYASRTPGLYLSLQRGLLCYLHPSNLHGPHAISYTGAGSGQITWVTLCINACASALRLSPHAS